MSASTVSRVEECPQEGRACRQSRRAFEDAVSALIHHRQLVNDGQVGGTVKAVTSNTLQQIDEVLGSWSIRRQTFRENEAKSLQDRIQFSGDADDIAHRVIRPSLEAIAERLTTNGGGGRVDERPPDARVALRLTLWMSLEGPVQLPARQDRNPFIQFDLDVIHRRFNVWEGDMWEKQGSSRATAPWELDDITTEAVFERTIAILRRAASHDCFITDVIKTHADVHP
jgi:hypothetical protein